MAKDTIGNELRRLLSRVDNPKRQMPHFWQVVKQSKGNKQFYVVSPMCLTKEKAKWHLGRAGVEDKFDYAMNEYAVEDEELTLISSEALWKTP